MSDADFQSAFVFLLPNEGGYQCSPKDRGNWTGGVVGTGILKGTNRGISAASYPDLDIKNLTLAQTATIYWVDYWDKFLIGLLPASISYKVFDFAVLAGGRKSSSVLQHACGTAGHAPVAFDGHIGPQTAACATACDASELMQAFQAGMADHFHACVDAQPDDAVFLDGWLKRAARTL